MRHRKNNKYMLLLLLLLGITIGYALISTTLKIEGTTNISNNTWNIYWDNAVVTDSNTSQVIPTIGQDQNEPLKTKVTWTTTLELPGDYYEFTVDAVNAGTVDAMITGIQSTVNGSAITTLPNYIKYTVTYADGIEPALNHKLAKATVVGNTSTPTREKYRVRVEYDEEKATGATINSMPSNGLSLEFEFDVTYGMATDEAEDINAPTTLGNDPWPVIKRAVNKDPTTYPVGSTKDIEMDLDGDNTNETYTLRVANNTTPQECNTTGFSQTACGFVLEFVGVFDESRRINPYDGSSTIGTGNNGGWEYSEIRAYLNNGKYLEGTANEVNYSTTGIFNKLPEDLRNIIVPTTVVSSHGSEGTTNIITQDKLFLFAYQEVMAANLNTETAFNLTRQLDYYKAQDVRVGNESGAYKYYQYSDEARGWWSRSAYSGTNRDFYFMPGNYCNYRSDNSCGISPAFKIN